MNLTPQQYAENLFNSLMPACPANIPDEQLLRNFEAGIQRLRAKRALNHTICHIFFRYDISKNIS